jgi:hypothetical protein
LGQSDVDEQSAAAYMHEAAAYLTVVANKQHAIAAAARRFNAKVRAGCANELPITPQSNSTETSLALEAGLELSLSAQRPIKRASIAFANATTRLSWDTAKVRRAIAAAGRSQRELWALHMPRLCADIRTAQVSGFAVLPRDAVRFISGFVDAIVPHGNPIPSEPEILRLLHADATAADTTLFDRVSRLVQSDNRSVTAHLKAAIATLTTLLGANPYP